MKLWLDNVTMYTVTHFNHTNWHVRSIESGERKCVKMCWRTTSIRPKWTETEKRLCHIRHYQIVITFEIYLRRVIWVCMWLMIIRCCRYLQYVAFEPFMEIAFGKLRFFRIIFVVVPISEVFKNVTDIHQSNKHKRRAMNSLWKDYEFGYVWQNI